MARTSAKAARESTIVTKRENAAAPPGNPRQSCPPATSAKRQSCPPAANANNTRDSAIAGNKPESSSEVVANNNRQSTSAVAAKQKRESAAISALSSGSKRESAAISALSSGGRQSTAAQNRQSTDASKGSALKKQCDVVREAVRLSHNTCKFTAKLPFVDCSIADIQKAISSEDSSCLFHEFFWQMLLRESPPLEAQPLKNRTLTFWIGFWNKWQKLKDKDGNLKQTMNVAQMTELFGPLDAAKKSGLIKLFDPEGFKRIKSAGASVKNSDAIKIDIAQVLTAGTMLSQLISTKHKLSFIFGIVDVNANKALEESEFIQFIMNFITGLGCAFGLKEQANVMPTASAIEIIAKRLFARVAHISAKRLRELLIAGDQRLVAAIRQGIRERLLPGAAPRGSSAAVFTRPVVFERQTSNERRKPQTVPFHILFEWCYRALRDPLALPYALTIERFCPHRQGYDIADEFDDALGDFSIIPGVELPIPTDERDSLAHQQDKLLSRVETVHAYLIFTFGKAAHWRETELCRFEDDLDLEIPAPSRQKFLDALRKMSPMQDITFMDFLRLLCPVAKPKHLRMFDSWAQQFSKIELEEEHLDKQVEITDAILDDNSKPPLPLGEIRALEIEFARIDTSGNGIIEPNEIAEAWGWSVEEIESVVAQYDVMADGCIDIDEFLRLMCPREYRLPESFTLGRDLLGKVLVDATTAQKESIEQKRELFKVGTATLPGVSSTPASLLPEVKEDTWQQWIREFEALDRNGNGLVELFELEQSGYFSREVCNAIMQTIVTEPGVRCFCQHSFLGAMLTVHHCRRKDFVY